MVAEIAAMVMVIALTAAELLHAGRIRRLAGLIFGPLRRPAAWVFAMPTLKVVGFGLLTWGMVTLYTLNAKTHKVGQMDEKDYQYLILMLDVSPSMKLADAGPDRKKRRDQRAADLLESFFQRAPMERYKTTVVAFYTDAKLVVQNTTDLEVVRNILTELPLSWAFQPGPTNLFAGLNEAIKVAKPLPPNSTVLLVVSDGDTVPTTGMPKLPASIGHVVFAGVGDPFSGKFIDGHQSRQDAMTLRQTAARLNGTYHNGNELHLSTDLLKRITQSPERSAFDKLTRREYALIAIGLGSVLLALIPVLLQRFGTRFKPGVLRTSESNRRLNREVLLTR
jgi:Ca-activated chloride channel homolog